MISEFDKVRIANLEEEANPGFYVSVDETGQLKKFPIPLKTIADAWPIGGLNIRGYATNAPILGVYYTAPPETLPLDAAPTTVGWGRMDVVAINTLNRIVIIPGTAGLVVVRPQVDENLYFPIRDLLILYGATEPVDPNTGTGNSNEFTLFAEFGTVAGGEANVTGSAASIAITAVGPISGLKSIEATNVQKLHESRYDFGTVKSTTGQTHFMFKLKLKATVQTSKYWFFRLYNGSSLIGSFLFKHGQYGFNANELGLQYISIPLAETPFKDISYTKATLFFYHSSSTIPGYWLDDVKFLNSLPTVVYLDQVQSDWNQTDQTKVDYIKGRFDQTLKEDKANKGAANGYAPLTASVKIAATYLDIVNDLITGGATNLLSAEQGVILKSQVDAIYILLASDNLNLDTVQEIVDAIETVQTSLATILVNDLTTGGVTKALTAEQGKVLKGLVDALTTSLANKVDKIAGKGLSTQDFTTIEKATLAKFNVPLTQDLIPVSQLDGSIIWQTAPAGGGGGVSIHNDLTGIQGGEVGDYQHLTSVEKIEIAQLIQNYSINTEIPTDWIDISSLVSAGQQKFVGLHQVWNNNVNYVTVKATISTGAQYKINWGNGVETLHDSGTIALGNLVYADYANYTTGGFRQAIITVTPVSGNFTLLDLNNKHNAGLANGFPTCWMDIKLSSSTITSFALYSTIVTHSNLYKFNYIGINAITNFSYSFANCKKLQNVNINTSLGTNFSHMFNGCSLLQTIPLLDTSSGTIFNNMFFNCISLITIPLINTGLARNFNSMFYGCSSLQTIPLINTSSVTDFSSTFRLCALLQTIPLIDTSASLTFLDMFNGCSSLKEIPLLNTSASTTFMSMFSSCLSLQTIPLINTSLGVSFRFMFNTCTALQTIPLINTSSGTNFANTFSNCSNLISIPAIVAHNSLLTVDYSGWLLSCPKLASCEIIGVRNTISYASCLLDKDNLVIIFNNLQTVTAKTITITGNVGASLLTASDRLIATNKGWTIVG